jgi:hypothetical protein
MANMVTANLFEGSPIIVGGGGSVNINFDEEAYQPVPDSPGVYVKDADELLAAYVVDLDGVPVGSDLTKFVEGRDCVITVHTINDKGRPSDIVIGSQPGGLIQLTFELSEFGPDLNEPRRRPHYNHDRKIIEPIEIFDNDTEEWVKSSIPEDGRCIITLVNSQPIRTS